MKLVQISRNFKTTRSYNSEELIPIVKHIDESAAESTPYSSINMLDEIIKVGEPLGLEGHECLATLGAVFQELIKRHKWYCCTGWHFIAKGDQNTMLRSVLYGALPYGFALNVQSISETVQKLTGEYPDSDTLRKNLQRLVNNDKFARSDRGIYTREVKGL